MIFNLGSGGDDSKIGTDDEFRALPLPADSLAKNISTIYDSEAHVTMTLEGDVLKINTVNI